MRTFPGWLREWRKRRRELDAESGLYFYRTRYYDPATGRFLSEDPTGFAARDLNLYQYVLNNPVNFKDPSGLQSTTAIPGGPPIAAHPVFTPGTPENKAFVDSTLKICGKIGEIFTGLGDLLFNESASGDGDIELTKHAEDQMRERGVSEAEVKEAIEKGIESPGNQPGTTVHDLGSSQSSTGQGVTVITTETSGGETKVITVIGKGSKFSP